VQDDRVATFFSSLNIAISAATRRVFWALEASNMHLRSGTRPNLITGKWGALQTSYI